MKSSSLRPPARAPRSPPYHPATPGPRALGGECLEAFERLREDAGLAEMLGHELPSPEAARKSLYAFHDPECLEQAQAELPVGQVSYIPRESEPSRALAQVNQDLVQAIGRRCAEQKIATVNLDATVIESPAASSPARGPNRPSPRESKTPSRSQAAPRRPASPWATVPHAPARRRPGTHRPRPDPSPPTAPVAADSLCPLPRTSGGKTGPRV